MSKKAYKLKVPCGFTAVDVSGRRVGAGKTSSFSSTEKARIEKYEKSVKAKKEEAAKKAATQKEEYNNGN